VCLVGFLGFAIYFCFARYSSYKETNPSEPLELRIDLNYYLTLSVTWLVAGIVAIVALVIVLLLILVLIKRIRLAIQLICEASRAVTSAFASLLFPVVPFVLQLAALGYFISVAVVLACSGKSLFRVANATTNGTSANSTILRPGDSCNVSTASAQGVICVFYRFGFDPSASILTLFDWLNTYQWLPQLYNLFMLFWVQAFIVGFNQMVLAGCFGAWYWSRGRASCTLLVSLKDTLVYHLGSIAFGSLLIAVCKLIRTLIQFVENRLKSATGQHSRLTCLVQFMLCCCKCCFWCLEHVLKFINRNAYIMVAIYGKAFCASARDAIALLASNPLRALVLDRVTDFVLFLGRLLITCGIGVLGFFFFTKRFYIAPDYRKYFAPDLHYYWLQLAVVIVAAYYIAKTFFTVFEVAVDTVFLCALKDLDEHDGTEHSPYYMSRKMLKILNVKNKPAAAEKYEETHINERF
jgi:solute carrier family 44 (choline transporter-like protein), member 2/4/5